MAAHDQSNVSKAQRVYTEGIFDAYAKSTDFLKFFQMETEEVPTNYLGRQITVETKANPSLSFGSLDGGVLATPNTPTLDNLLVTYQWMNAGFEQTYGAILNNSKETVDDPFQRMVKSSAKQFSVWLNYYLSAGDGTTKLATASAAYNGGTPTVMTCSGATDSFGATRVVDGQRGYIYDSTGTTQRTGTVGSGVLTISSHTKTAITFSSNLPSDFISGDIFVPEGGNTTGIKGLPYLVNNTGNYFNKSRSSVTQLQSQVISVGGALSNAVLRQLEAQCSFASGIAIEDGNATVCMALSQWYAYLDLVTPLSFQHTSAGRPGNDIGGNNLTVTWYGRPMKTFFWLRSDHLYRLNLDSFKMAVLKKVGQLRDMPASDWMQKIDSTTIGYAAARQQWLDFAGDAYTREPFKQGVLTGLTMTQAMQRS